MMTVISLILILATLAMPMYHTVVVRAREVTLRDDLFTLRSQIDRFTHDYERGPSSLDELVEKEYMGAVPRGQSRYRRLRLDRQNQYGYDKNRVRRLTMGDPVSGPEVFAFFVFALIVMLWIAVDPRRVLEFLFSSAKPLGNGVVVSLRILAALCCCGLSVVLIIHLVRSH